MVPRFIAIAFLCIAPFAQAASLYVEIPVQAVRHPAQAFHAADKSTIALLVGSLSLEGANAADYVTTRRGAFPGGAGACEMNPLFRDHGQDCRINVTRFTIVKAAIGAFGIAQWTPVWTGHAGNAYKVNMTIIDGALSVPLAIADAGNIKWLRAHGAL